MEAIAILIALLSPFFLWFAPASWKGKTMISVCMALSLVLAAGGVYLDGGFANLDWHSAARLAAVFLACEGAQQRIFSIFKDSLGLADPPRSSTPAVAAPVVPIAPPPLPGGGAPPRRKAARRKA